ncbi:MAG: thioredoxin family protein, partial [Bdellovibrionales bacterium]|nr:thioredoxin family protein [Bdellovibrionales bacterium]
VAKTPSNMVDLGSAAPDFRLQNVVTGGYSSLEDFHSEKGTVIMFICNHCPFVIHVEDQLIQLAQDYSKKGFQFVAISSNDVANYPEDSPEKMKERAHTNHYPFAYLYDETQEVAKAYHAACTPDFFVYDPALKLVYRGQLDGSRPGNDIPVTGKDLRQALDCLDTGQPIPQSQTPSLGCNIKWKE